MKSWISTVKSRFGLHCVISCCGSYALISAKKSTRYSKVYTTLRNIEAEKRVVTHSSALLRKEPFEISTNNIT